MHEKEAMWTHRMGKHLLYNVGSGSIKPGYPIPFFLNYKKPKRGEDDCGLAVFVNSEHEDSCRMTAGRLPVDLKIEVAPVILAFKMGDRWMTAHDCR